MEKDKRVVHGSYESSEELASVIRQLRDQGYTKEQITVYSSGDSNDRTYDKAGKKQEAKRNDQTDDRTYDKIDKNEAEKRDERTFDKTDRDAYDENEEGSFDTVDKNSEERSEHGSFDVVDKDKDQATEMRTSGRDNDESVWEQIKDFFTPNAYDYEQESQNPNYRKENDILYPHRQDLIRGNRVVVLDKPNEEMNRVNI